jgi:hypothetical protein
MFDLSNYSAYDEWLNVFAEASARLDALDTRNPGPPPVRRWPRLQ